MYTKNDTPFTAEIGGLELSVSAHNNPDNISRRYQLEIPSINPELIGRYSDKYLLPYYASRMGIGGPVLGILDSMRVTPKDDVESLALAMVVVDTSHIPDGTPYKNLKGAGSYLLDIFCGELDEGNLRGYLNHQSLGGRLDNRKLSKWYSSRGFQPKSTQPPSSQIGIYSMQREPVTANGSA